MAFDDDDSPPETKVSHLSHDGGELPPAMAIWNDLRLPQASPLSNTARTKSSARVVSGNGLAELENSMAEMSNCLNRSDTTNHEIATGISLSEKNSYGTSFSSNVQLSQAANLVSHQGRADGKYRQLRGFPALAQAIEGASDSKISLDTQVNSHTLARREGGSSHISTRSRNLAELVQATARNASSLRATTRGLTESFSDLVLCQDGNAASSSHTTLPFTTVDPAPMVKWPTAALGESTLKSHHASLNASSTQSSATSTLSHPTWRHDLHTVSPPLVMHSTIHSPSIDVPKPSVLAENAQQHAFPLIQVSSGPYSLHRHPSPYTTSLAPSGFPQVIMVAPYQPTMTGGHQTQARGFHVPTAMQVYHPQPSYNYFSENNYHINFSYAFQGYPRLHANHQPHGSQTSGNERPINEKSNGKQSIQDKTPLRRNSYEPINYSRDAVGGQPGIQGNVTGMPFRGIHPQARRRHVPLGSATYPLSAPKTNFRKELDQKVMAFEGSARDPVTIAQAFPNTGFTPAHKTISQAHHSRVSETNKTRYLGDREPEDSFCPAHLNCKVWVSGIPADASLNDIFSAIIEGKIYLFSKRDATHRWPSAGASITFTTRASALAFFNRAQPGGSGVFVRGRRVSVIWDRHPGYPADLDTDSEVSRVVEFYGPTIMNPEEVLENLHGLISFHLVVPMVSWITRDGSRVGFRLAFESILGQSRSAIKCFIAFAEANGLRGQVATRYVSDPCNQSAGPASVPKVLKDNSVVDREGVNCKLQWDSRGQEENDSDEDFQSQ